MSVCPRVFPRLAAILLVAPLTMLLSPGLATANDPLRCEMHKASEKLRDYFTGRRIQEISVGEVTNGDPTTPSTAGPGIRPLLIEELGRAELKVKHKADVGLAVTYRGRKVPSKNDRKVERIVIEMRFTASFTLENSQEDILTYRIEDEEAICIILGQTVVYTPPGKESAQQGVLAFDKPKTHFDGTVVLAKENDLYGVEILIDNKPLKPENEDGFSFVKMQRDQTYAVRLINRSSIEVAVRLSIDGLNVFVFSELRQKEGPFVGAPLYDMFLVPPQESVTIKGWHRNNTTTNQFKITDYADTAAAKMNKATDLGTITATFCAAWEKTPPKDEENGSRAVGDGGTGVGPPITQNYTVVQRIVGRVRASVAVRYRIPPPPK